MSVREPHCPLWLVGIAILEIAVIVTGAAFLFWVVFVMSRPPLAAQTWAKLVATFLGGPLLVTLAAAVIGCRLTARGRGGAGLAVALAPLGLLGLSALWAARA